MLFYQPAFLVFSLILIAILSVVNRGEPRKVVLLIASYIFYMWWNPAFIILIVFSTQVNYLVSLGLGMTASPARRKFLLCVALTASLGTLCAFKYTNFLEDNLLIGMRLLGYEVHWTWLRDYLYIPLGGSRHGLGHTCRNLMITMLLGGLWHGASWNFVLWGFLHGIALVVHRLWRTYLPPATRPVSGFVKVINTFICWVAAYGITFYILPILMPLQ